MPDVIVATSDTLNRILTAFVKDSDGDYKAYAGNLPFTLRVMNRWGKEMFHSTDPVTGWDGDGCETGVYYYVITIADRKFKGPVSVLR